MSVTNQHAVLTVQSEQDHVCRAALAHRAGTAADDM